MLKPDLKQRIDDSEVFVALMSPKFFEDPGWVEGLKYAISQKKPIYVLKERGVEIPPELMEGLTVRCTREFDGPVGSDSCEAQTHALYNQVGRDQNRRFTNIDRIEEL